MSLYLDQFNYQLYGPENSLNGRRWVFLHGLMGSGQNWRRIVSQMPPDDQILTYDQRGHGRSMKPMTGYASEDYAEDLYLIVQDLKWEKFVLVGHSMGGRNALMFAHLFPEKLSHLIISDIGPEGKPEAIDYYKKMLGLIPEPFTNKREAKSFFANQFNSVFREAFGSHENLETLGAYLYSNLDEDEKGQAVWRFSSEAIISSVIQGRAKDHWRELRMLPMPTLVVRGDRSQELSLTEFHKMQASNPRITGVEIANAGHWVHADQPIVFADTIKQFVETS
jgi:esterase